MPERWQNGGERRGAAPDPGIFGNRKRYLARQLGFAKCDFLLVVLAALRGGTVRQVVGSEDGAVAPRAKEADAARQHGFAGSADEQS